MDGADPGVTLHAPKGSAVYGDRFYVADIDVAGRSTGPPARRSARGRCRTPAS